MYQRTMTGPLSAEVAAHFTQDATAREKWVAAPVIAVILLLGFVPNLALSVAEPVAVAAVSHVGAADPVAPLGEEGK
jgi:NADH-quinone oxidoreductase subunit M